MSDEQRTDAAVELLNKWLYYSSDVEEWRITSCGLEIRILNDIYSCMFILYVEGNRKQ